MVKFRRYGMAKESKTFVEEFAMYYLTKLDKWCKATASDMLDAETDKELLSMSNDVMNFKKIQDVMIRVLNNDYNCNNGNIKRIINSQKFNNNSLIQKYNSADVNLSSGYKLREILSQMFWDEHPKWKHFISQIAKTGHFHFTKINA